MGHPMNMDEIYWNIWWVVWNLNDIFPQKGGNIHHPNWRSSHVSEGWKHQEFQRNVTNTLELIVRTGGENCRRKLGWGRGKKWLMGISNMEDEDWAKNAERQFGQQDWFILPKNHLLWMCPPKWERHLKKRWELMARFQKVNWAQMWSQIHIRLGVNRQSPLFSGLGVYTTVREILRFVICIIIIVCYYICMRNM